VRARSWILATILVAGCSDGSGDRAAESRSPSETRAKVQEKALAREPQSPRAGPGAKPIKPAKPESRKVRSKPVRQLRGLPWRRDGTSRVVHVRVRRVAVYKSPTAKRPNLLLRKRDPRGTQRAFLVRATRGKWVRVYLPTRPNGSQGWVRRRALRMYNNRYRIVIRLRSHKLHLWRERRLVATYRIALGTSRTPTPRGLFYITELLKPRSPHGPYGPYSFGLSAHSNVLKRFAGGDGRVGLHGTNQPGLIGSNVSNGCIRLRNPAIRRLAKILPLGTPVHVRS
jgi:lipoprotein-anchoring transpeptidase ErfK/SrfK